MPRCPRGTPGGASRSARRTGSAYWDIAFAYEALARARSVARDYPERDELLAKAREAAAHIDEAEDRDLLLSDLETI